MEWKRRVRGRDLEEFETEVVTMEELILDQVHV